MERQEALDDLKAIRKIMERTRRASSRTGGWFMILWGTVWLIGYLGSQFLSDEASGWLWFCLDTMGFLGSVWLMWRSRRHERVRSSIWWVVAFWWLALFAFDLLLVFLLPLRDEREIVLLITLTIALGYFQFGLFTHWIISVIGTSLAVLVVLASLFIENYFYATVAVLGGFLLISTGIWGIRRGM